MEPSNNKPQVLIVGAGPTGLTLAIALLRQGVSVRIIDKNIKPIPGQRGSGIHPRIFEIFEALGVLDDVLRLSRSVPKVRVYKMPEATEVLKETHLTIVVDPTPDIPYPNGLFLGQNHLESTLAETLQSKYGCSIERGIELKSFDQNQEGIVHATLQNVTSNKIEEADFLYLIGADGGKSTIRKSLGLSFLGETLEQRIVLGDFVTEGLSGEYMHFWGDLKGLGFVARPTEDPNLFTIMAGGAESEIADLNPEEAVRALSKAVTNVREDIKIKECIWAGPYRFNVRMASEFSKGNVFIAGDAAHVHSPTGGQGLNTGIQDAYNLAWKLALVHKGHSPFSLLSTYSTERVPVVAEMLNLTSALMHKTLSGKEWNNDETFDRGGKLKQLGVNYRYSPIVVDEGEERVVVSPYGGAPGDFVRAGDRAPDATGLINLTSANTEPTRLFKVFDSRLHTILIFEDSLIGGIAAAPDPESLLGRYPGDLVQLVVVRKSGPTSVNLKSIKLLEDAQGHAYKAYSGSDGASNVFVVRPDGYVGARAPGLDGIKKYFDGLSHIL